MTIYLNNMITNNTVCNNILFFVKPHTFKLQMASTVLVKSKVDADMEQLKNEKMMREFLG